MKDTEKATPKKVLGDLIVSVISIGLPALCIAIFVSFFVPSGSLTSRVDGRSMMPTLTDKQIIYADATPIERGDIVTAKMPEVLIEYHQKEANASVVKRVIGMPGDEILITQEGVHVNGQLLVEEYLSEENKAYNYEGTIYHTVTLGEDEYYLIGDNRANSGDSRQYGVFKEEDILYKQSETITLNVIVRIAGTLVFGFVAFVVVGRFETPLEKFVYRMLGIKE